VTLEIGIVLALSLMLIDSQQICLKLDLILSFRLKVVIWAPIYIRILFRLSL